MWNNPGKLQRVSLVCLLLTLLAEVRTLLYPPPTGETCWMLVELLAAWRLVGTGLNSSLN